METEKYLEFEEKKIGKYRSLIKASVFLVENDSDDYNKIMLIDKVKVKNEEELKVDFSIFVNIKHSEDIEEEPLFVELVDMQRGEKGYKVKKLTEIKIGPRETYEDLIISPEIVNLKSDIYDVSLNLNLRFVDIVLRRKGNHAIVIRSKANNEKTILDSIYFDII